MSELIIIQESSDAAAKDLDRPMCSGPRLGTRGLGTRVVRTRGSGPVNGMGICVFGCRGPEHGERI